MEVLYHFRNRILVHLHSRLANRFDGSGIALTGVEQIDSVLHERRQLEKWIPRDSLTRYVLPAGLSVPLILNVV
jgi:hypothetical protein